LLGKLFTPLMSKHFFIGVDGGATSCRARIRDLDGNLLGEGEGGPANICSNLELAIQSLRQAITTARRAAGLGDGSLRHAHVGLGLAGAGLQSACDRLIAHSSPYESVVLETDAYVAWLGAHQGEDGGIVILGTGSCGLAVVNGRRSGVAGWGPEISDEAGGQRMGREALRRALWAYDGRAEETELTVHILDRFRWDPAKMVLFAANASAADFAKFAPLVFQCASSRDPVAISLVKEAAAAASAIVERLLALGAPKVSLIGGLSEPLRPWLLTRVANYIADPHSDAVDGAILMARRAFFKLDSVTLRAG
jgi:glucosamine kinase